MTTKYKVLMCNQCKEPVEITGSIPACPQCHTILFSPEEQTQRDIHLLLKEQQALEKTLEELKEQKTKQPSFTASLTGFIMRSIIATIAFSISPIIGIVAIVFMLLPLFKK